MEVGWGGQETFFFYYSLFREFESSLVREFKLFWEFGLFFLNFVKFATSGFYDRCSGTGCESVVGW